MNDGVRSSRVLDAPERLSEPFVAKPLPASGAEPEEDPIEAALASARDKGYQEGRERAETELAREVESIRGELSAALEQLAGVERELTRQHTARLLEAVVEAASRIVRDRIESGDPVAARALDEALEALPDGAGIRARVHPDDRQAIATALRTEMDAGRLELLADPEVTRGGVRVDFEAGRVDATIETASDAMRSAVLGTEPGS